VIRELQQHIANNRPKAIAPDDVATSPASVKRGIRFSHSSTATVISRRARFEPTQRWMPRAAFATAYGAALRGQFDRAAAWPAHASLEIC
jgi:hypothetical protein